MQNPAGAYLHDFSYSPNADAPEAYLNFEGVDSCFYVWLNGEFVGYSQVSHATAEFRVTNYLLDGHNTLAVLVLKWCDGSYLEDQDKFRTSGIFRDVHLLLRPTATLQDYFITTDITGAWDAPANTAIRIDATFTGNVTSNTLTIQDATGIPFVTGSFEEGSTREGYTHSALLTIKQVKLWNAENPYLYTLIFETPGEVIVDRLGVRTIEIEGQVVLLNGVPVKMRGVNRHDSDPVMGPAVDIELVKHDLKLIKSITSMPCVPAITLIRPTCISSAMSTG